MRRVSLLTLHLIVGLNALAGGYYGISGAPQVPLEWLKGSPFSSYFVPGLILLFLVGGSQLLAALFIAFRSPQTAKVSAVAGAILLIWISAQVLIIGYVSWLQPALALLAVTTILLAKRKPLSERQFL